MKRPAHRPRLDPAYARVLFSTRVHPGTLAIIRADRRPGESTGQVLDRWAFRCLYGLNKSI